jgi:uncharacterized protein (TIRG00374 family)
VTDDTSEIDQPGDDKPPKMRASKWTWIVSILMLIALIAVIYTHLGETEKFLALAKHANLWWLTLAAGLQVMTYVSAGLVWREVIVSGKYHLSVGTLARLSIEQLTMNQLVPTSGMSGSFLVVRALRRRNIPGWLAMEALMIDVLGFWASFAAAAILSLITLWYYHRVTPIVVSLVGVFSLVVVGIPFLVFWLLRNRHWEPPERLRRRKLVARGLEWMKQVSASRVLHPRLLAIAALLHLGVFFLDAGTLWATLRAVGTHADPMTTFVAWTVGSIAGTVSFLPGGLGSFEAGCATTLALLGIDLEAALAGTLLLRGLTFWLPLLPGWMLAKRELMPAVQSVPHE